MGATLQYYPVLHSAFWIEHRLWGDSTLAYHMMNLLLHAAVALLAALILRRLKVPGAYLAAAIFALHPINVESAAWISEQKNTLSGAFYLGAMLAILRFDETRKLAWYAGSLALFLLAVLTKTVTATLPGALLVILWWQRGRLEWKRDVVPLVPWFVLGAGGGLITAWWELQINACVGPDFAFTPIERCLIAGRTVWFLLGKLFWPSELAFSYPRWQIDAGIGWQYVFPLGAAALLVVLWAMRRFARRRWPPCCSSGARSSRCWAFSTCTRSAIHSSRIITSIWPAWGSSRWWRRGRPCCWIVGGNGVGRPVMRRVSRC